jgi:hypothetical protein
MPWPKCFGTYSLLAFLKMEEMGKAFFCPVRPAEQGRAGEATGGPGGLPPRLQCRLTSSVLIIVFPLKSYLFPGCTFECDEFLKIF